MTPNITVLTNDPITDPEVKAMVSAYYSRSSMPIQERLQEIDEKKIKQAKDALELYSIGYGHQSIRDMATAMVFVEGVSFLAAKALEHHPLGNYQETSSRYIDFSTQGYISPFPEYNHIMDNWVDFYTETRQEVEDWLLRVTEKTPEQKQDVFEKAIRAKSFDICRALLPAGMKTQLAISMNFRAFHEHLQMLLHHPLSEVEVAANIIHNKLETTYPHSFPRLEISEFLREVAKEEYYYEPLINLITSKSEPLHITKRQLDGRIFNGFELNLRKNKEIFPYAWNQFIALDIEYILDYGSWRDLQRHRNVIYNGASSISHQSKFFLAQYFGDTPVLDKVESFVRNQFKLIESMEKKLLDYLAINDHATEYYYPLGNTIQGKLIITIPQLYYIMELRSSKSVHPTLRNLIQTIWGRLETTESQEKLSGHKVHSSKINVDMTAASFHYERGKQDITKKGTTDENVSV